MKRIIPTAMILLIFLGILLFSINSSSSQETRVIKILDANTGLNSVSLGSETVPVPPGGHPFTVNITLEGTTDLLFTYQVAVKFDRTKVRCSAAWIDRDDAAFVFYDYRSVAVIPSAYISNDQAYVVLGASLVKPYYVNVVTKRLLCQINFTAIKIGTSTVEIIPTGGKPDETFLWGRNETDPEKLRDLSFTSESFSVTTVAGPTSPVASFISIPTNPQANQNVTFDASESYDPDGGEIVSYFWDFGDNTNATTTNAIITHNYTLNGAYLANLTVFDNDGYHGSMIKEIQVGKIPYVNFTYEPMEIRQFESVTFDASRSDDSDGNIVSYVWDFGDGNVTTVNEAIITHAFSNKGIFLTNLTIYDNDGLHNSTAQYIFVGRRPVANFTFNPENPRVNDIVTFNASQSQAGETGDVIVRLVWDFGDYNITEVDVTSSDSWIIQHVYTAPGEYPVTLTVYDNNGLYNSTIQIITVKEVQKPSDNTTYIIVGAVVVAVIIIIIAAVFLKRKRTRSRRLLHKKASKPHSPAGRSRV